MSGSTGTPMNLNTFDGTDDIVKALTDLFNQNMNLINGGDNHTKVWKPNTAYIGGDILIHPYHNSLIYALSSHTSSNSTTEADWSTNDGVKWQNLSYAPIIANWMANMNYNVGDLLMDGLELKQATTAGSTATLDRTRSAFIGSRVANWTPNTKYNIGDLAYVGLVGSLATGKISNAIVRCVASHNSGLMFPASSDKLWEIINKDAYSISVQMNYIWGRPAVFFRNGNDVKFSYQTTKGSGTVPKGKTDVNETLPVWANPAIEVDGNNDPKVYIPGIDLVTNLNTYTIILRRTSVGKSQISVFSDIQAGFELQANVIYKTDDPYVWASGIVQ